MYGLLFSAKHYERARMHTEILRQIRAEIDRGPNPARSLRQLTQAGKAIHYQECRWPSVRAEGRDRRQAVSWVARQRPNVFWEAVHVLVLFIGVGLLIAIWVTHGLPRDDDLKNVLVVAAPRTGPAGTTTSPGGGR